MTKKVLRIITRLNVGGPTKHVAWLSSGLEREGWQGRLVCGQVEADEDDMSTFLDAYGVQSTLMPSLKRSIEPLQDLLTIRALYVLIAEFRPDVVHTHMSKAGLVGRLAVMAYNTVHRHQIKTVHTFHGHTFHGYFSPHKEVLFLAIERFLARFATTWIITISPQQRAEILAQYRVGRAHQHHQINLGIETGFARELDRHTLRAALGIGAQERVVGIVGRIAEIKNHELFIEAVRAYRRRFATAPLRFVVIGDGEAGYVRGIKALAAGLDELVFAGNQTDPRVFYGALDALALTSDNEGTPVSILEAFACGIPVVARGVGGVVDLIGTDERGLGVDKDPEQIAQALYDTFHGDPVARCERTERARRFVEENYSVQGLVRSVKSLYEGPSG